MNTDKPAAVLVNAFGRRITGLVALSNDLDLMNPDDPVEMSHVIRHPELLKVMAHQFVQESILKVIVRYVGKTARHVGVETIRRPALSAARRLQTFNPAGTGLVSKTAISSESIAKRAHDIFVRRK